jgi:hypothetical protein
MTAYRVERIEILDGSTGWLYSDGSVRADNGQLLAPHPNGAPPITPANSAQMRELRALKHSDATAQGLLASARRNVGVDKVPGTLAAWAAAAEHLMDSFFDPSTKPRDQAEIYKAIALALDAIPARVPAASGQPAGDPMQDKLMRALYGKFLEWYATKKAGQVTGRPERDRDVLAIADDPYDDPDDDECGNGERTE